MGNYFTDVDWSVFTHEEEATLKVMAAAGRTDFATIFSSVRLDRVIEHQLQKLVDAVAVPVLPTEESEVLKELAVTEAKAGRPAITTPEEEKEWQKKIDEEKEKHKAKKLSKKEQKKLDAEKNITA